MSEQSRVKRICIIKTSSLGDVVHTLPAITDACRNDPAYVFDWVVEEQYQDIPALHPGVDNVLPIALRRWRRSPVKSLFGEEFQQFRREINTHRYDLVIDAQGLLKSALISALVPGHVVGLDGVSIREPVASWFYSMKFPVARDQHAVERIRQLFAQALGYVIPDSEADYGISGQHLLYERNEPGILRNQQIIFLHGTTWASKHWPESHWRDLAVLIDATEYELIIPWGNDSEKSRAERIADGLDSVSILPRMGLTGLVEVMDGVSGAFCVDTGLCHLAAALNIPCVAFYGPTDPGLTGNYGPNQVQIVNEELSCIPCLSRECRLLQPGDKFPPCFAIDEVEIVWQQLVRLMQQRENDRA